jgi:hypothetical protein
VARDHLTGPGEVRSVPQAHGDRPSAGSPGEAAERVLPEREFGAVVTGLRQVDAVMQPRLLGPREDVVERAIRTSMLACTQ